jgi:hypothetical protein
MAAMHNRPRPISMPAGRYENLPLQKLHTAHKANEKIRTADTERL